jgi:DNA repair protein RadC
VVDLVYEEFWVLYLNRSNTMIECTKISQGGLSGTVTDVRLIMKTAIELLASSIILAHNHPSGNIQPSEADKAVTRKLKETGDLMDIKVIDHLILSENNYFSFADAGLI